MKRKELRWGDLAGREIVLLEWEGPSGMRARVSNYGGALQSLVVPKEDGALDVVLGYDCLQDYVSATTFFGAMIGPIADRMDGGRCVLNGTDVQLDKNAGPDSMHSGPRGFHAQAWNWDWLEDGVVLYRRFLPEDIGFPGELKAELRYRLLEGNALRLEYAARCDCETAVSFTNHSYFNLDGGQNACLKHRLSLAADRYAETRRAQDPICTGRALPVENTPFDFRAPRPIEESLSHADFAEIRSAGGVDHYFLVPGEGMRLHASLESLESGLRLRCFSDAPGLLVYTGNGLAHEAGKGGAVYGRHWGVCLETGRFPNAVNFPAWRPQVLLHPGERYASATEFRFDHCATA